MKEGGVQLHLRYLKLSALGRYPQLVHGFSTRRGGISQSPFSSLNLSLEVGDDPERVQENRRHLLKDLRIAGRPLVKVKQVHGDGMLMIDEERAGRPGFPEEISSCSADALLTAAPGIILTTSVADCVPILLFDPKNGVIASVHGGWRSTAGRLAAKVIRRLEEDFGTRPEDCVAALGPSIGLCCYEVDEPVIEAFAGSFRRWEELVRKKGQGRWHLDLLKANEVLLLESSVSADSIFSAGYCVSCHTDLFFSHRRDGGNTGRMMGLAMLRDGNG